MFVELAYGIWTNSLGLISDSAHMLFDCTALFIGLFVSYISKFKHNKEYTFGYKRYEVLSGFFNSMFLVFVGFNILIESVERIFSP
jgi:zinc transporter 5/7